MARFGSGSVLSSPPARRHAVSTARGSSARGRSASLAASRSSIPSRRYRSDGSAADTRIVLSWYDCIEPFVLNAPPGFNNRPIGVFSTFFPARGAQLEINGKVAAGSAWAEMRGDRQGSSATLAWSETWVKPRG